MPLIFLPFWFFSKLLRWTLCLKPFVLTFCFHLTVWKCFNFRVVCFAVVFLVLFSLSIASILGTPSSQEIILVLYCPYVCVAALTARLVKVVHVTCTRIAGAGSLIQIGADWRVCPASTQILYAKYRCRAICHRRVGTTAYLKTTIVKWYSSSFMCPSLSYIEF